MGFLRLIIISLIFSLLTGPSVSHQMAQQQAGPQTFSSPESISPHLIELYIDINEDIDLRPIWQSLRIESSLPHKCKECIAETFDIEGLNQQGHTVALRITWGSGNHYQYLMFRKAVSSATERWKFIGHIDSGGQPFAPPVHRVEIGENRAWFVIRELWGQSSDSKAYGEVWYEIGENDLKQVLSYPLSGESRLCQKGFSYSYRSILSRHASMNGNYTVPIQLLISYNITDCEKGKAAPVLFTKEQKAFYIWNDAQKRFQLDAAQSDVTEKEIKSIFSIEGPTDEDFAQYNFDQLSEIAKSGDAKQQYWLKQFLIRLKDSPQKTALMKAINSLPSDKEL